MLEWILRHLFLFETCRVRYHATDMDDARFCRMLRKVCPRTDSFTIDLAYVIAWTHWRRDNLSKPHDVWYSLASDIRELIICRCLAVIRHDQVFHTLSGHVWGDLWGIACSIGLCTHCHNDHRSSVHNDWRQLDMEVVILVIH